MGSAAGREPSFSVDVEVRDGVTIVRAAGELDLAADPVLGAVLAQAEAAERPIIADLTDAIFCASCVLGQLAATATRRHAAGSVLLVATAKRPVLRPLTLLGMERYLQVVPDVATAVHRLRHSGALRHPPG